MQKMSNETEREEQATTTSGSGFRVLGGGRCGSGSVVWFAGCLMGCCLVCLLLALLFCCSSLLVLLLCVAHAAHSRTRAFMYPISLSGGGMNCVSCDFFEYIMRVPLFSVCVFPRGIPQLQSDWSLSCDHGLDHAREQQQQQQSERCAFSATFSCFIHSYLVFCFVLVLVSCSYTPRETASFGIDYFILLTLCTGLHSRSDAI